MTERRALEDRTPSDAGFTLLEVIVAIALVGIIATAGFSVVTRGLAGTATIQQSQTATTLGNEAMELTRGVIGRRIEASGPKLAVPTGLVVGRAEDAVSQQWGRSTHPDLNTSNQVHDPNATAASVPVLPLSTTTAQRGSVYTIETLVGTCYRQRDQTSSACLGGAALPSAPTGPGWNVMVRVMVEVSWTRAGEACATCTYYLTSLVDPTKESTWIPGAGLAAVDDVVDVTPGTTVVVDVLANDIGKRAGSPITIKSGAAQVNSAGQVTYTAPAGAGGTAVQFTYTFINSTGVESNEAVVTVKLIAAAPVANDDTVTVQDGKSVPISVLGNDIAQTDGLAAPVAVVTALPAGRGDLSVTGGVVTYTDNAAASDSGLETATFTYRVTDTGGRVSNTATVTVRVVAAPVAASYTASTIRVAAEPTYAISPAPLPQGTRVDAAGAALAVVSQPAAGLGTVAVSGQGFTYAPGTGAGLVSFTYRIVQEGGTSNVATITFTVEQDVRHDRYLETWTANKDYSPGYDVTANDGNAAGAVKAVTLTRDKCVSSTGAEDQRIGQGTMNGRLVLLQSKEGPKGSCTLSYRVELNAGGSYDGKLTVTFR